MKIANEAYLVVDAASQEVSIKIMEVGEFLSDLATFSHIFNNILSFPCASSIQ